MGVQLFKCPNHYFQNNENILLAGGSIALSDNTAANVAQYSLDNSTWAAVGSSSDIPGPVSAIEVNSGNASSIFAAGKYVVGVLLCVQNSK